MSTTGCIMHSHYSIHALFIVSCRIVIKKTSWNGQQEFAKKILWLNMMREMQFATDMCL